MFPGVDPPTRLSSPNCNSIGSAVFPQFTAENPYIFQCTLNAISARLKN